MKKIKTEQLYCRHDFQKGECLACGWLERDCAPDYEPDEVEQYKRTKELSPDGVWGY